ncbi:aspartyl-phosphate phosphatase Spo0E family protein [Clostridium sp. C2-6-12]|nr:aspartyl-phosphate phosphatase Spo0E family protein [Clostridium sp. C2-6-12]
MDKRGEQLREQMYEEINKNGGNLTCKEVVQASQRLDRYMNKNCSYKN